MRKRLHGPVLGMMSVVGLLAVAAVSCVRGADAPEDRAAERTKTDLAELEQAALQTDSTATLLSGVKPGATIDRPQLVQLLGDRVPAAAGQPCSDLGQVCDTPSFAPITACGGFSDTCDSSGTQSGLVVVFRCLSNGSNAVCTGVIEDSTPVTRTCSRVTNGLTTCGPNGNDSCCTSTEVIGGDYYRSYDLAGDGNSGNTSAPATVSSFRLDKYEVTVGRFREFVVAGKGTQASPPLLGSGAHAKITGTGWDTAWNANLEADTPTLKVRLKCDSTYQMYHTWTDSPGANENRPITCVTWYEAMAFCAWDGGYLPTEAEWNYAATGGAQQRAYPWSSPAGSLTSLDGLHASYADGNNCVGDGMAGCAITDLAAVGTKPAGDGRWGQSDLAGNVEEWTLDSIQPLVYTSPCVDCAQLSPPAFRVFRGGWFGNSALYLRAGHRDYGRPTDRYFSVGVRCARAL